MINPSTGIVDWHVDLFYDGQWHEITDDVQVTDNLQITRGRSDYASEIPPTSASFVLDNTEGKYSPKNPMSPLYGKIGRNQPVRIRVGERQPVWVFDGGAVHTPDGAGVFAPQDEKLFVDVELHPDTWRPAAPQLVVVKGATGSWPDVSWFVRLTEDGEVQFAWYNQQGDRIWVFRSDPVPADTGSRAFRFIWSPFGEEQVPESEGHPTVTSYWAPALEQPWRSEPDNVEFVEDVTEANLTPTSADVAIGATPTGGSLGSYGDPLIGEVTRVRISTADVTLADVTGGDEGATDATGRMWSVSEDGVRFEDRSIRFAGDVQAWPPRWGQPDGSDAHTPIEAFGVRRRLEHTSEEAKSPFRRASDNEGLAARNLAYWPMEDASGAMAFASEVGDYEMVFGNIPGYHIRDIELAQDSSFYASKPLPRFNITAAVGRVRPSEPTGEYRLYALVKLPEDGVPKADDDTDNIVDLLTLQMAGTISEWVIQVNSSGYMRFKRVLASTGAVGYTDWLTAPPVWESEHSGFNGLNLLTGIWVRQNGAHVDYQLFYRAMGRSQAYAYDAVRSFADLGYPTAVSVGAVGDLGGTVVGHVTLRNRDTNDGSTLWDLVKHALHGDVPETATERVTRLVDEEGMPVIVAPAPLTSEAVGVQKTATVLDILDDTTSSDLATLIDDRASHAMRYRPRSTLYNQRPVVLDYAAGHIIEPFEPTDDDADIVNDVTVTREDGGSFRAVEREGPLSTEAPPDGIGRYEASHTFNLASDAQLANQAGWRLHLGTVDEVRYPRVSVSLNGSPELIDTLLPVDVGDRVQIENLPKWLPPNMADVIVQGYTEESDGLQWTVSLNCTPASPWSVGVADDPVYGRADTAGSELVYAVDDTAQVLPVLTTEGPRWVQASDVGGQFPFEATVGGEIVTVTSVIPLLSDDFVRGDAGVWDDPVRGLWDNTFIWSA